LKAENDGSAGFFLKKIQSGFAGISESFEDQLPVLKGIIICQMDKTRGWTR
jgi:hypothetical protein